MCPGIVKEAGWEFRKAIAFRSYYDITTTIRYIVIKTAHCMASCRCFTGNSTDAGPYARQSQLIIQGTLCAHFCKPSRQRRRTILSGHNNKTCGTPAPLAQIDGRLPKREISRLRGCCRLRMVLVIALHANRHQKHDALLSLCETSVNHYIKIMTYSQKMRRPLCTRLSTHSLDEHLKIRLCYVYI